MNKAQKLLNEINAHLDAGNSVTFTTRLRATRVTAATVKKWKKSGFDLFRIEGEHLCIASGKRFESVMGCKITATAGKKAA